MTQEHKENALEMIVKNPENGDSPSLAINEEDLISLTESEKLVEEELITLSQMKAPHDAGNRILKAVFAEAGIKREPFENMEKKQHFLRFNVQYLYIVLTAIITIMGLRLTYTIITNWGILGDPDSIIQTYSTIKSKMPQIENTNYYKIYSPESKPFDYSDRTDEVLRKYAVAGVLFDGRLNKRLNRLYIEYLNPPKDAGEAKLIKERLNQITKVSRKFLDVISESKSRNWSLDNVKLAPRDLYDHADKFGVSYTKTRAFEYFVMKYFLSKAQLSFYGNKPDHAIEDLITVLRFLEYVRTRQTHLSIMDKSSDSSDFLKNTLYVLDQNQQKLKTASSDKLSTLKKVLKQANPMTSFKRFAYRNASFIGNAIDLFFGLHRMNSKSAFEPDGPSFTADLMRNRYMRWFLRPLLIYDAKKYMQYQLKVIEHLEESEDGTSFIKRFKGFQPDHSIDWLQVMTGAPEPDYKEVIKKILANEALLEKAINSVSKYIKY